MKKLQTMFSTECDQLRIEICFIFSNMVCNAPEEVSAEKLMEWLEVVPFCLEMLKSENNEYVFTALSCVNRLLRVSEKQMKKEEKEGEKEGQEGAKKKYCALGLQLYGMGGVDLIEELQEHAEVKTFQLAKAILGKYYTL